MAVATQAAGKRNGLATASLILGIFTWIPGMVLSLIGSMTGVVAVILGVIALTQISRDKTSGKGSAIAGIVLGGVGAVLAPIITIAILMIMGPMISNTFSTINASLLTVTAAP